MEQQPEIVAIATMSADEVITTLIESNHPFAPQHVNNEEKLLRIGNLLFPKAWYCVFDLLNLEGVKEMKKTLNMRA